MNTNEIIELDNEYIAHTYGRLKLAPVYGKNATLYDNEGKKYIDFTSGIGVNSLGIADDELCDAVYEQMKHIQHISNYYYSPVSALLAKDIVKSSGMKKVIFQNSGAEANEAAIKVARKYSFDKYGEGRSKIITLVNSFHGRTVTTLSATGQDVFHRFFFPFTEGFCHVPANDVEALKNELDGTVCAIMLEVIQGEGGVNLLEKDYVKKVKEICDENDILLIFDEVQTGIGRTGKLYAHSHFGATPDVFTLAKGLGGGLPIGCVVLGEKCESVFGKSDHGTTFGGNPAVCAGARVVMSRVNSKAFLKEVTEKGEYVRKTVSEWELPVVKNIRGLGLMIGIEVDADHKALVGKALTKGLMLLTAGKNVVRMLPPLTISYTELDEGLKILKKILSEA